MDAQINDHAAVSDLLLNYKQLSDEYLSGKIQKIHENYQLWNRYQDERDLKDIKDYTIFYVIDTLISIDQKDELLVNFKTKSTSNIEKLRAEKIKNMAMIDSDEMEYQETRIEANFYSYFCGLGVRYNNKWNGYNQCPEFIAMKPTQLLLDPQGGKNIKNHRFIGFRAIYKRSDMKGEEWIEKNVEEALKEMDDGDEEQKQDRERENRDFGYQSETERKIQMLEGKINVCDFFCRIQDGKDLKTYFITMTQRNGKILRIKEIEPITEEEKMYPEKIRFPVVFTRYAETIGADPIGKSVFDLIQDKQRTKSIVSNIMNQTIAKNVAETIVVKGRVDLSDIDTSSDKVLAIPEDTRNRQVSAGNIVTQLPKQYIDISAMQSMTHETDKEIDRLVAVNDSILGAGSTDAGTLGEAEQIQSNAGVRHEKRIHRQVKSEIDFWKVWLECYMRNYNGGKSYTTEEKGVELEKKIEKSDLKNKILKIEIGSKILNERINRTKKMNLLSVQGAIQVVHAENKIAGKIYMRRLLRLGGEGEEEIMAMVPMDSIEIIIEQETEMLKQNIPIKLKDTDDPLSRVPFQMDINTSAGLNRRIDLKMAIKKLDIERAEQARIQKQMQQISRPPEGTNMLRQQINQDMIEGRQKEVARNPVV